VLAGELIDRCEYYLDLEIMTPQRRIAADLASAAGLLPPGSGGRP